jgi:hypothetical protein
VNPPISTDAPARPAPARARRTDVGSDGDAGEKKAPYRPAHAAHARPAVDDHDDLLLDLTDDGDDDVVLAGPLVEADDHRGGADADPETPDSIAVVDDVVVVFDDPVIEAIPAPTEPLVGARAAARAKRRRHTGEAAPQSDTDAAIAWSTEPGDAMPLGTEPYPDAVPTTTEARSTPTHFDAEPVATVTAGTVPYPDAASNIAMPSDAELLDAASPAAETLRESRRSATPLDSAVGPAAAAPAAAERDPMAFIRSVEAAWTAASCWVRRHATVQLVIPCLVLVFLGFVAVVAADGTMQRLGQIVLTAALVTAGVAWAQAIGDQRRRQQDLRFRLASGNLERADLTGTVLDGFTLWGQNLRGAKLSGCSADHVLLSGADLREASMTGASLRVASLAGADLTGARLYRSDLRGADLTGAIAQGTSFEDAILRGALLEGADLTGADLSGADLRGATHDEHTNWAGIVVNDETHLPEDMPALQA